MGAKGAAEIIYGRELSKQGDNRENFLHEKEKEYSHSP